MIEEDENEDESTIEGQECEFCEKPATGIYGENYVCEDHGHDPA